MFLILSSGKVGKIEGVFYPFEMGWLMLLIGVVGEEFRPFFKSLLVYRVFLRFESQLSPKGNGQIPERISRWQRCSAVIGPDQLPSRALPSRNSLSAINERTFGKRSNEI